MKILLRGKGSAMPSFIATQSWLIMKMTAVLLTVCFLQVAATGISQTVTFSGKNVPIEKLFSAIRRQTGYGFFYNERDIKRMTPVTVNVKDLSLEQTLAECLRLQPLTFVIKGKTVFITVKPAPASQQSATLPASPPVIDISGKVTDAEGGPLAGANVRVKGSEKGTSTNAQGEFILKEVDPQATLEISYVGLDTKTVPVRNASRLTIVLENKNAKLSEVVVVSYGRQKRVDVTGSIAQLNAGSLEDMPVGQFAQRLQGQLSGVSVNINTGRPGQGLAIQVRGAVSINAGNYPLVVVDGQPLSPFGNANPINNINPDEIESYTVLKDAAATALYGSRAASGVILITTKQARAGKPRIDINAYYGLSSLDRMHMPKMMDARQLATFMNEFFQDKIKYEGYINPVTNTPTVPAEYANPSQYGKGTDWLGLVTRTAPTQSYSLSFSDAREKSSTSVIAGYFNQQGIILNTGFQRYSLRVNNEFRPLKTLKIGLNIAPSVQLDHNAASGPTDGIRNIVEGSLLSSPIVKPYNPDGSMVNQASGFFLLAEPNFAKVARANKDDYTTERILGNAYVEWEAIKGLTLKTATGVDFQNQNHNRFVDTIAAAAFNAPPPRPLSSASAFAGTDYYFSWVNENTLTYKTSILRDHHIEALAGYTVQQFTENTSSTTGTNFSSLSIPYVSAAGTTTGTNGYTQWSLLSMIGRLNYNFRDRYLLSGAIRRDGSSKFGLDRQYGVFPSVSAGWVLTEEPFIKALRPVNTQIISLLKIRASYGLTGNNNFITGGNYPSYSLINTTAYVLNNGLVQGTYVSQLGNSLLTWEKNKQFDAGIDIDILRGRISLTYDYYHKVTDGLLYQVNIPQSSGYGSVNSNIGTFRFWGHELSVASKNLTGPLGWNTRFNIAFNRNLIVKLGTQNLPIMPVNAYSYPNIQMVGQPVGMFYGYVADGVYKNQQEFDADPKDATSMVGSVRMKDMNHDGKITTDDRAIIGNPNPSFIFGLTNSFNYGAFDLNIVFTGSVGGKIEDLRAQSAANLDGAFNLYANQLDHWRSPDDPGNGIVPGTRAGTTALYRTVNSLWVHDGSYVTCKNISLGYTLPLKRNNKAISRLRVYGSIQQAFTITSYPGLSPETNSQGTSGLNGLTLGVDNTEYPIPRTITLGVNVGLF